MPKFLYALGCGVLTTALAIIIQKADRVPGIWYSWLLTNPHVVPGLLTFSILCFLIALGQAHWAKSIYWKVFALLIGPEGPSKPGRLKIDSASFGNGPKTDRRVTERVQELCSGDSLDILVSYQVLIGNDPVKDDPAPGENKRIVVRYSFGDGPLITTERPQSTRLILPEDPYLLRRLEEATLSATRTPLLKIISAFYGTSQLNDVNVADKIRANATDGLVIPIENHLLVDQDPAPNKHKRLRVVYSYGNDTEWEISRPEGVRLILPEDLELMKRMENKHWQEIAAMREEHRQELDARVNELTALINSLRASSSGAQ